jgi:hypothetical protein
VATEHLDQFDLLHVLRYSNNKKFCHAANIRITRLKTVLNYFQKNLRETGWVFIPSNNVIPNIFYSNCSGLNMFT